MSRLFVALWPPASVIKTLAERVDPLREVLPDVKWQPRHRWHITVAFLGDRDEDFERERFARIDTVAAEPVSVSGAGHFGPVLYAGIDTGDWLKALAHHTRRTCRVRERRRYRAHVTLGRIRSAGAREQLAQAVATLQDFRSPAWIPEELTLVRSTIGPEPQYEVVARSRLPNGA